MHSFGIVLVDKFSLDIKYDAAMYSNGSQKARYNYINSLEINFLSSFEQNLIIIPPISEKLKHCFFPTAVDTSKFTISRLRT